MDRPLIDTLTDKKNASFNINKRLPKKKLKKSTDDSELKYLENLVFGDQNEILENIDKDVDLISVDVGGVFDNDDTSSLFVLDRTGSRNNDVHGDERTNVLQTTTIEESFFETNSVVEKPTIEEKILKPAWHDDDDDIDAGEGFDGCQKMPKLICSEDNYKEYLEKKFTLVYDTPSWATKALEKKQSKKRTQVDSDSESDDDILERTVRDYKQTKKSGLSKDFLHVKKCAHINHTSRVNTSLNCVQFHQSSTVAMLGSPVGLVRLFKIDGKINSIIQSIYFRGYRLSSAKFLSFGGREEIIVGSDGSDPKSLGFAFCFDMIAGKIIRIKLEKANKRRYTLRKFQISPDCRYLAASDTNGYINILSTSSKEHISELKMNGEVDCLGFSSNSNYLLAHGKDNDSQAYIWDIRNLRSQCCVNKFNDLGTVEATSLAISGGGSLAAIGSNMGVVNLYKFDELLTKQNPEPIRSIMNLTTAITSLCFNQDEQLLLISSSEKNDAIRFVNTNTATVYKNFPIFVGANKTYGRIYDVDFSPNSGYAAFATGAGTGHLFRINPYESY